MSKVPFVVCANHESLIIQSYNLQIRQMMLVKAQIL